MTVHQHERPRGAKARGLLSDPAGRPRYSRPTGAATTPTTVRAHAPGVNRAAGRPARKPAGRGEQDACYGQFGEHTHAVIPGPAGDSW
ncbi:hypothetical protein SAMN05216371_1327 [Streptomyces sp. TLI_053]|nr:hypothetical protein SAMN05216371_1327 [Streptomyces sp. TLI_053]